MTQQEALTRAKEMLPHLADVLRLARSHSIGLHYGHDDEFIIWDHSNGDCLILANSHHSWDLPADHSAVDELSMILERRRQRLKPKPPTMAERISGLIVNRFGTGQGPADKLAEEITNLMKEDKS